ncbi:hypothetical protein SOL79_06760 [Streptococcus sp. VEG1o]
MSEYIAFKEPFGSFLCYDGIMKYSKKIKDKHIEDGQKSWKKKHGC